MTDSTGSERCFWISAGPGLMSRFPGSEGERRPQPSLGPSTGGGLTQGRGVSVSGVTWTPLDTDSWDLSGN
ncbi:hypothetical protein EYF80_043051 [Liparis tanakae]|uniref:Uncharacterized protein n=1 Tax=Liparis tanakae TaxID=230148 RepID=A0A4Z2FZL9_9TELE|nr:hypothetical protein EYF80_043051 [Liparis tanakae]